MLIHVMKRRTLLILITWSKVNVNFCTVCKTLWTWYRLQFLPNQFQNPFVRCINLLILGGGVKGRGLFGILFVEFVSTMRLRFFINNFQTPYFLRCRWEETLLNLCDCAKGQDQPKWKSGHDTKFFLCNHTQTSYVSCSWWEEEPYWLWCIGS